MGEDQIREQELGDYLDNQFPWPENEGDNA